MKCSQCRGIEKLFDRKMAEKELERYRNNGPTKTTNMLLDVLRKQDVKGRSVLDIGGGVGAIQQELLKAGASEATDADASEAYIEVARQEATRRGNSERIHFYHGDFVDLASEIPPADIVTLDRMICCYPDARIVLRLAAQKTKKFLGLIYPRDTWLMKWSTPVMNSLFYLRNNPFRLFVHERKTVNEEILNSGFKQVFSAKTMIWQVTLYERNEKKNE